MLDLLHKFILALISGITEFLPVSAAAHRELYQQITGCGAPGQGFILAVHIGCLAAIIACNRTKLLRLSRHKRMARGRRGRGRPVDPTIVLDMRLLRVAAIPVLISILFYGKAGELLSNLGFLALFLLINGFLIMLPRFLSQGNKDSKHLSMLDGLLIGLGGGRRDSWIFPDRRLHSAWSCERCRAQLCVGFCSAFGDSIHGWCCDHGYLFDVRHQNGCHIPCFAWLDRCRRCRICRSIY